MENNGGEVTYAKGAAHGGVPVGSVPANANASAASPANASSCGRLSIVSTPIGNLGDITLRALDRLREADVVLAEDTRVTRKLLSHHGISTPLERCDENVIAERTPDVVARVEAGARIAFVSDAGTPGVSDPGMRLVQAVRAAQESGTDIELEVVPGASAVLTALAGAGFTSQAFYFGGFLPRKAGEKRRLLDTLAKLDATLVFYESNHRTAASLEAIAEAMPGRSVCMARELTKLHEEFAFAPASELAARIGERADLKGEVVIVIGAPEATATRAADAPVDRDAARARGLSLMADGGLTRAKAAKQLVSEFGIPRADAYDLLGS